MEWGGVVGITRFRILEMLRTNLTIKLTQTWQVNIDLLFLGVEVFVIDNVFVFGAAFELMG